MALIKPPKQHQPEGEGDPRKDRAQEEQLKRKGLIKGQFMPGIADFAGGPGPKAPPQAGGRLLKATAILNMGEDVGKAAPAPRQTQILKSSDFLPSSMSDEGAGTDGQGRPRGMVTIPAAEQPKAPQQASDAPETDGEFKVESPQVYTPADIEAMIAEAEQRGREKAAQIIEHAQAEAKNLIEQARIYGETAKAEAQREGMKEGKELGYQEGLNQFSAMMAEAKNLFSQLVEERRSILESVEPELAKLSVDIARKIIGQELTANPDMVMGVIREALGNIKNREQVTIKVHPDDLEMVKGKKEVFAAMIEGIKDLVIAADGKVEKGGCLFETNLGNTDARISTQMEVIRLAFEKVEKENA